MTKTDINTNIVLIGMPAVGKSTVGVLLAKATGRGFIDTDVVMQARQGRPLQQIIESQGLAGFCRLEERHVLDLSLRSHVIATGGSVVYSQAAMAHLRDGGLLVNIELPLDMLQRRLSNMKARGIVMAGGTTLGELYEERMPLYRAWADITLDCTGMNQDEVVALIVGAI